jgi:diguanylate cyclase (GGDEF)-like protein
MRRIFAAGLSARGRLGLLFWALVIAMAVTSVVFVVMLARFDQHAHLNLQRNVSQRAAGQVEGFLRQQEQVLWLFAQYGPEDAQHSPETVQQLLDGSPAVLEVAILDRQGVIIAHAVKDRPRISGEAARKSIWFQRALAGQNFLSQLPGEREPALLLSLPASNGMVLAARLDSRRMWESVNPQQFGKTGRIYLVGPQGLLVAPPGLAWEPPPSARPDFAGTGEAGPNLLEVSGWPDGRPVVLSTAAIPRAEWLIVAEESAWEFYASSLAYAATTGAALLALCFLLNQILVRFTRSQRARERQLDEQIQERIRAEARLSYGAFHDPLTGLPNRALFLERLQHVLLRATRSPAARFAVLILDCDRFMLINDSLGHPAGDRFLIGLAERLENSLRASDTVARLGGDEFVILLEDAASLSDAIQVAERIRDLLKQPFQMDQYQFPATVSIGIVFGGQEYISPQEVLRDADIALYQAKSLGRDRYEIFDSSQRQRVISQMEIESELRQAVANYEFVLHYQPIFSLTDNQIAGFEALIRWNSPRRGLIGPGEFIPIAEETGLILSIGEWVIDEACRQIACWQKVFPHDPPLSMNVNISGVQFFNPAFPGQVRAGLEKTGLAPSSLKLEITESVFMETSGRAADILDQLRVIGVQIEIDDFGTGYSSLAYLHRFPISTIKIDRSFIQGISSGPAAKDLVKTIVNLAYALGMQAVAEGVETRQQVDLLRDLNCPLIQGFYFSQPKKPVEIENLLSNPQAWPVA